MAKKPIKKAVKKAVQKRIKKTGSSPRPRVTQHTRMLAMAKDIIENRPDGSFVVMAKVTEKEKGFGVEGSCTVNKLPSMTLAKVLMNATKLDPLVFIIAHAKTGAVVDLTKKKK